MALQEGFGLFQQGRWAEAGQVFAAVLAAEPGNAVAHHLLGLTAFQTGDFEGGVAALRRSIALHPRDAAAHGNLANGLRHLGRRDEALHHYAQALAVDPGFLDALVNRAALLTTLGRLEEALADYDRALALQPGNPVLHTHRGNLLLDLGRPEDALASYNQVAAAMPELAEAWGNLANALYELGRTEEALAAGDRAIAINPQSAQGHANRGNALLRLNRAAEALVSYQRAADLEPGMAQAWSNGGNALRVLGRHEEAIERCARAVALDPAYVEPRLNRACALAELGRHDEALEDYRVALEIAPGRPEAELAAAVCRLTLGDFERGWALYDARQRIKDRRHYARTFDHPQPLWLGQTSLEGKTILLRGEQGLGDILQFCRYAPLVKALGARVVLEAEPPLMRVLRTLDGVDELIAHGDPLPDFDVHCPLMSLPLAFGTTVKTIPAAVPYLAAEPDRVGAWAARLGPKTRPRVGLVWSGGVRHDHVDFGALNERRNIPLSKFAPFKGLDVEFVSLQKGDPAEGELAALRASGWDGPDIVGLTAHIGDFADTAALIENLDLVVAVDTSTAHMAGALGRPVWILNRYDACWRWLNRREDSPWYPTARLFHQSRFGDWDELLARVRAALAAWAG
jgi:tetratricopeptide (TPR) repeat protein